MIDMGLTSGAKSLWEDNLLFDYTIQVEGQEFRAHKVVLASVSEYFRVMFMGSMKESQTDRVELKDLSAETFSMLLTLIYTGNEDIVKENAAEIFPCAMYLDVQSAIKVCKKEMINSLDETNCLDILALFLTHGESCDGVKDFVHRNWKTVFDKCKPKDLTYDVVQVFNDIWGGSEWQLFELVKEWTDADKKNRVTHMNNLMGRVRFSLMTPQELAAVKKTPTYKQSKDTWRELVDKAVAYHKLPMHSKVLEHSEQTTIRSEAEPVLFTENNYKGSKTCIAQKFVSNLVMPFRKNEMATQWETRGLLKRWETYEVKGPKFPSAIGGVVQVNNFLICYTELDKGQTEWYIFDARTLKWAEMASMSRPKAAFALVHHDKHLYVIGGRTDKAPYTKSVEQYDFGTNTWKSTGKLMPLPAREQSACVLGDFIYCCGGYISNEGLSVRTTRMDRLDTTTHKWESREPTLGPEHSDDGMCVMKMSGEEVIVLVRKYRVDTYNPNTDQWSVWDTLTTNFRTLRWDDLSRVMTQGDTIFLLNVLKVDNDPEPDSDSSSDDDFLGLSASVRFKRACCRWTMIEKVNLPFSLYLGAMPVPQDRTGRPEDLFGALLALPFHKMK